MPVGKGQVPQPLTSCRGLPKPCCTRHTLSFCKLQVPAHTHVGGTPRLTMHPQEGDEAGGWRGMFDTTWLSQNTRGRVEAVLGHTLSLGTHEAASSLWCKMRTPGGCPGFCECGLLSDGRVALRDAWGDTG